MSHIVIHLHQSAPAKPEVGTACNGCGACCATEPCPLGVVISRKRSGPCVALEWIDALQRYQCGVLNKAALSGRSSLRLVTRWIAAGKGCDAELQLTPASMQALHDPARQGPAHHWAAAN
jgi:hypothetical protein